jgi:hypothetical protein
MDCPKCGTSNRDDDEVCRMCGQRLKNEAIVSGKIVSCPSCRTENPSERRTCSVCGKPLYMGAAKIAPEDDYDWRKPERTYLDYATSASRTMTTGTGGALILLAAFTALADIVITLMVTYDVTQLADYRDLTDSYPALEDAVNTMVACQALRFVFVAIAFMGGTLAMKRSRWGLAMLGGVFSVLALMSSLLAFVMPWWLLIVFLVWCGAIIGTIMVGISRREFVI